MSLIFAILAGVFLGVPVLFWALGMARVDLVRIHTQVEIDATAPAVWAVLTDFEAYRRWNPLMIEVHGQVQPGERMDWQASVGGSTREYNARIDRVAPHQELSWTGPISSLGKALFWGEHRFIIEELPAGGVRLINKERFGGLLTLALYSFLKNDLAAAYDAANTALKQQVEQPQSTSDSSRIEREPAASAHAARSF